MKHSFVISLLLSLHFIFCQQALSQVSDLDVGFGNDGVVVQDAGSELESGNAIALQADGKIVVAGHWAQDEFETILLRFNEDGSLDTDFGTGGIFITDTTDAVGYVAFGLAIQPDGKILAAGQAIDSTGVRFMLLRLNTDGSLDDSFGVGGVALADAGGEISSGFGVAVQPDDKILVSGFSNTNNLHDNITIVRFNPDGILDNSFDEDGIVVTNIENNNSRAFTVNLTPDGKIVVGGRMANGSTTNITVLRYNLDGSLDPGFSEDGIITTQIATVNDVYLPVAATVQPDGKILVTTNSFTNNVNGGFALLRYKTDGSLDSLFGENGKTLTAIGSFDAGRAVVVQPDGKIVVAGYSYSNFNPQAADMVLLRYFTNGELDTQFGIEGLGLIIADINSQGDIALAMALQSDGKILLTGSTVVSNIADIAVLRFLPYLSAAWEAQASVLDIALYPNPVLETAMLDYELSENTKLSVKLYDTHGRLLMTLMENEAKAAGKHQESLTFPRTVLAGDYLLIMETEKGKTGIKMMLGW